MESKWKHLNQILDVRVMGEDRTVWARMDIVHGNEDEHGQEDKCMEP